MKQISRKVKTLGDQAFQGCNNLTDAVFESAAPPETVGSQIFDDCSNGLTIWVPNEAAVSRYENITNFSGYQDRISAPAETADNATFTDGILTYMVTSAESKTAELTLCEVTWNGVKTWAQYILFLTYTTGKTSC